MEQNKNPRPPESTPDGSPHGFGDPNPAIPSFLPVPVRYRHDGWTPARQRAFIEHLADTLCAQTSAERVGMTEQSAYRLRRRAGAEGFAAAWDAALRQTIPRIVSSALEKAVNGTIVRRYYHGRLVAEERVHSERLIMFLLEKASKLIGGSEESRAIERDWDGGMARLESGEMEGPWRVWQDEYGNWLTNFPPPEDFDGFEHRHSGDHEYHRTLTDEEEAAMEGRAGGAHSEARAAREARDAFFGFEAGRRTDRQKRSKRPK